MEAKEEVKNESPAKKNEAENPEEDDAEARFADLNEKPEDQLEDFQVDNDEETQFKLSKEDLEYLQSDKTWKDVGIPEKLIKNLENSGYIRPSKIQGATLPMVLKRSTSITLLAQSKNGSGKTLCFVLPCLVKIKEEIPYKKDNLLAPQAIIIVPTFELILQVANVINKKILKSSFPNLKVEKITEAKKAFEGGHLLIGTPNSINALVRQGDVKMTLENLKILAVDEADNIFMNSMSEPELYKILVKINKLDASLLLFSATFPPESVSKITNLKRKNFFKIMVGKKEELTLKNVHQFYFDVIGNEGENINQEARSQKKNQVIGSIFKQVTKNQSIIFVNSKKAAISLMTYLRDVEKHSVGLIMGYPMTKDERELVIRKFSQKEFEVLITTNLLSRGIDMRAVNLIINADLPELYETKSPDYETYLHRIGRTGRFGDIGLALNLIDGTKTRNMIDSFRKYYDCKIECLKDLKDLPKYIDNIVAENEKKRGEMKEEF